MVASEVERHRHVAHGSECFWARFAEEACKLTSNLLTLPPVLQGWSALFETSPYESHNVCLIRNSLPDLITSIVTCSLNLSINVHISLYETKRTKLTYSLKVAKGDRG